MNISPPHTPIDQSVSRRLAEDSPLPRRGPGTDAALARPEELPIVRRGRMLKRWRYLGVYGPELMLCVGEACIGPGRMAWWASWDRERGELGERTTMRPGLVELSPGRVQVHDGESGLDLTFEEEAGVAVLTQGDPLPIWTRKQAPIAVRGSARVGGREFAVDSLGLIDDTVAYYPRRTAWRWCAGVGTDLEGRPVGWNLVSGVNDGAASSERAVWLDGEPHEPGRVEISADLSTVRGADGSELHFDAEAVRERNDRLILFRSRYVQPFGTFSGTLPGGVELAEGYGVMEDHEARW